MDWKQFIASIVGSLAWPLVLLIFLWVIRSRIGGLLSRMIELHLPGGAKAIFAQQLDKGREAIEALGDDQGDKVYFQWTEGREGRENAPQWLILESYIELETEILKAREPLGLSDLLPNLPSFIRRVCSSFAPRWGVLRTQLV